MAFNPKSILSIDVDADTIVAAELVKKHGRISLVNYTTARSLRDINSVFPPQDRFVAAGLPTQSLLVKSFPAPQSLLKSKDQKKDIVTFLNRQNLPVRLEECFWHVFFSPGYINLVAARKDTVDRTLRAFNEAGIAVSAVIPSFLALVNLAVFLYGEKDRTTIVSIRSDSSDLIITENRRTWVYPMPVGHRSPGVQSISDEIRRVLNIHLMQNPAAKPQSAVYVAGLAVPDSLIDVLKQLFPGADVVRLEPLKKILAERNVLPDDAAQMNCALGVGITAAETAHTRPVNLIGEKVRMARFASRVDLAGRLAFAGAVALLLALIGLNVLSSMAFSRVSGLAGASKTQAASLVPRIKELKSEKDVLAKAQGFLQQKFDMPGMYLRAMAAVTGAAPEQLHIDDLEAKSAGAGLDVFLGGKAGEYNAINDFLVKLKSRPDVHDVKVVASTLPDAAASAQGIDFKIRFSLQ